MMSPCAGHGILIGGKYTGSIFVRSRISKKMDNGCSIEDKLVGQEIVLVCFHNKHRLQGVKRALSTTTPSTISGPEVVARNKCEAELKYFLSFTEVHVKGFCRYHKN